MRGMDGPRPPPEPQQYPLDMDAQRGGLLAPATRGVARGGETGVSKANDRTVHIVHLTSDEEFRRVLRGELKYYALPDPQPARIDDVILDALKGIADLTGAKVAVRIQHLDLSRNARGGAYRARLNAWRAAGRIADHFNRTTSGGPRFRWTRRTVIIAALYCAGIDRGL